MAEMGSCMNMNDNDIETETEMEMETETEMGMDISCMEQFLDKGSVESHRYFLARKTLFELLKDRGYGVTDTEFSCSLDEFRSEFGDVPDPLSLCIRAHLLANPSSQVLVFFCVPTPINKANMLTIFDQIAEKEKLHLVILVLQSKMNHFARKIVEAYPIKVETFQITELLANTTKHVLAPKFELLTTEEKQSLLQKYQVKDEQLPGMQKNDVLARYYGFEKGQVVKVIRTGADAGPRVTYRCIM